MSELNLSEEEGEELRDMIEDEAQKYLDDEEVAKESLEILGKSAENKYGIKKAAFKKIAKAYHQSNIDEQTEIAIKFKELYQEALGEVAVEGEEC